MIDNMLVIPSIPNRINEVEKYLQKMIKQLKIKEERYPDILISLTEAVNNAIIHGNKKDRSKHVRIEMKKKCGELLFIVSDEGRGFEVEEVPDPTCPEHIECCGGRGVHIMSSLADHITFQDNGSTVEMRFQL